MNRINQTVVEQDYTVIKNQNALVLLSYFFRMDVQSD